MALDPSIPLQVNQAPNILAQYAQAQNVATGINQNQAAQRQLERQNKLANILSQGYETPEARESALLQGGFIDESTKLGKERRENRKTDVETQGKVYENTAKKLDIAGQVFGYVRQNPTLEAAYQALDVLEREGVYPPEQIAMFRRNATANPASIQGFADQAFQSSLKAKDQLAQFQTRNTGATTDTIAIDPVTGKANVVSSVRNTISPDAALSASTTRRGQDLTNARAREANTIAKDNKPLTEGQAKSAAFGSRMKSADEVINSLEKSGKLFSTPGARAGYGIGAAVNLLNSAEGQQLDQAKRDFINATLRRESGAVISDAEFENAEKQYFPQIGDKPEVIKQKARNRQVAQRGVLADVPEGRREGLVTEITGGPRGGSNIDALLDKYK